MVRLSLGWMIHFSVCGILVVLMILVFANTDENSIGVLITAPLLFGWGLYILITSALFSVIALIMRRFKNPPWYLALIVHSFLLFSVLRNQL